ncbi:hypothetical protein FIBSPDRAFT_809236 [Athelia psychrophila]|uniref:Dynamitin-domain-containing protein n=1 Tax=Athelia psychrophila TaxID=1759441 RepID=A0A166WWX9_9AGAM|nr:hypothetical protein FIBSPDRAFT_809236 [Fibularhizoctonia sp. CBS 109695]
MSANKYSNLPYIDTAQDVYETEDVFPATRAEDADTSDEELAVPTRSARDRNGIASKEELDQSNLISPEEASKRFKKADRKQRSRPTYAYPPSPDSGPTSPSNAHRPIPLSQRLRALQSELASLEVELADPSNPLLAREREEDSVDPGELIRGLVDVRGRLEKISKGKEGRGRLVNAVMGQGDVDVKPSDHHAGSEEVETEKPEQDNVSAPDAHAVVEMDRRVGELEKLVGSSNTALDETTPLPPPLLPLISRLNSQLTLLTQPRHIDSISRRLKLLLTDLDRASASQQHTSHRRQTSQPNTGPAPGSAMQEQLLPLLTRLGPSLPQIPHILTRLRTLSALHTSASEFSDTLEGLEEEQRKMREALTELDEAVETVEESLEENQGLVKGNVSGLEERVDGLLRRLEEMSK